MSEEQKSLHIHMMHGEMSFTDTEKSFCYEGYEVPFELNHVLYRG